MSQSVLMTSLGLVLVLSVLRPSFVFGQDSVEAVALETIEIADESDQNSSVVTDKVIEEKQARNLQEVFQGSPDVVVGGPQRAAQKIYVRGIEDTNLNVTVDGARQSGYMFHHQTRLNVDPELLKRVDVEAGTGNALAGPGALGGALRFVTKDAEDLLLPNENWGSLVKGWSHSNNDEKGGSFALFGRPTETLSALGSLTLTESGDAHAGGGEAIPYSAGKPKSALAKISYRPGPAHKITLAGNFTSDNAVRLTRANLGGTATSLTMDRLFETSNTTLSYVHAPTSGAHVFQAEGYLAHNKLQSRSGTGTKATFQSHGANLNDTIERPWGKITFGVDANQDAAEAENQTRRGQERGTILGLFAQSRFNLTDSLRLGIGARFDDYRLKTIDEQVFSDSHLSPNVNLGSQWTRAWSSKLSWNQAFRGPVPVEVFLLANATSVAPVSDLKGTVAETTELSNKFVWEDLRAVFDLSLYSTLLHRPLESSISSGVITRANSVNDLKVQGLEAKAKKSFGSFLDGNLFYSHSRTKFGSNDMGYSGNFTRGVSLGDRIGFGAEWRLPDQRVTLSWNGIFVMKLTDVPSGFVPQPGYDLHDFTATWLLNERLRVLFVVANIFDKKYIAQGSWYAGSSGNENLLYEPGRDFRFALHSQF